jgi:transcriptional regulator of acetoin/glycerol metabolism
MEVLKSGNNISEIFLESLIGAHLQLPNLDMRTDFEKITKELLAQVSPKHHISKNALDTLCSRDWPGHLGQLKKVLRVLVSTSDAHVIRNASIQHDQKLSGVEIRPCDACSNSPIRKENCTLIRKSWLDTGQNISLASRRLGVSRNTVYRHIKNM